MLSTEDKKAPILSYLNNETLLWFPDDYWSNKNLTKRHLYILSNEEIKNGDNMEPGEWYINTWNNSEPFKNDNLDNNGYCKKIIAATDKSLNLPGLSQEFVEEFINSWNSKELIQQVNVECEKKWNTYIDEDIADSTFDYYFKIDNFNQITISKIKESWNREEVTELIYSAMKSRAYTSLTEFNDWVEENL